MKPIIQVKGISKQYAIGAAQMAHDTLRDQLAYSARTSLRQLKRIARGQGDGGRSTRADESFWALKDVSFDVMPGEVVGIIGRNGAGKSTLLKVLSRITEPTEGRIELYGRVGSLLEVGTGFHPELTGRENIYLNGAILGMQQAEIKRKFDEIVAFAEMERFLDTPVKRYSSGMYMRLAFAVAAHLEPEVLVIDEVLAVGDANFQRKCLNKMQDVSERGRTVLFVSHNMAAVTRLCRNAIWINSGRIEQSGPADRVVSNYLRAGTMTTAAREWPDIEKAPGNEMARLLAVRVLDKTGQVAETIDIRDPIRIEIEYYNFSNRGFPYANIQLFDESGICLFATGDFTNRDWRHKSRNFSGRVKSTCTIPGNFLSEGQISVLAALTTHTPPEALALEQDTVTFLIVDSSEGDGARGEYAGPFPGVLRPLLDWEIKYD